MKGLRIATLVASLVALVPVLLVAVLLLYLNSSGASCSDICDFYVGIIGLALAVIVLAASAVAVVCAAIDAGRRSDGLSVALLSLQLPLSIAAIIYLVIAVNVTNGPEGPSVGVPSTSVAFIVGIMCLLIAPLATLLYALLRDQSALYRAVLSLLAAVVIVAPLAVAPPWIAFNTANWPPELTTNAPNATVLCPGGPFPPITIQNAGSGTLQWSAEPLGKPNIVPVTISPASGTLGPGMSQQVTISGPATAAGGGYQAVSIVFTSNGGTQDVVFMCQ